MTEGTLELLDEAERWANRAEENYAKADGYKDRYCRSTMLMLARQAEQLAERSVELALAVAKLTEVKEMERSKSGLPPYRAGLSFILREVAHSHRTSRQARAAIEAGDIKNIRQWQVIRLLANSFDKNCGDVARDLVDYHRALEQSTPAP